MPAVPVEVELRDRREKLVAVRATLPSSQQLTHLLEEVDAALARIAAGSYGLCEECHEPIEADRLTADPLIRTCLDHLSPDERRAIEQDLDLTGRVQLSLLPPNPFRIDGWETTYRYQPLRAASGDYCDLVPSANGELLFLLGDVAGKGVAASVLMAHLHGMFRSLLSLDLPFEDLVLRANRIFCETTGGQHYATLVCGRASRDGRIEICNAGHCPPLLLRGDTDLLPVPATGLPIGLFTAAPCTVTELSLEPGDTLVIYTDGVTEACDTGGDEYGDARLQSSLHRSRRSPLAELLAACVGDLERFRSGAPRTDDVTMMAIRRNV